MRKSILFVLGFVMLLSAFSGCGPDVEGVWDGSGEFYTGRNFSMVMDVSDNGVTASFTDMKGNTSDIVLCDLHYNSDSGEVRFAFNPFAQQQDCSSLQDVYLFNGTMGYAVIAGDIKDVNDKVVGIFRAIKRQR